MGVGDDIANAKLIVRQVNQKSSENVQLVRRLTPEYDRKRESRPQSIDKVVVDIGKVCEVNDLTVQKAIALKARYDAGDIEILVPGPLLTKEILAVGDLFVKVGGTPYSIEKAAPRKTSFETVTEWRLVCSKLKG